MTLGRKVGGGGWIAVHVNPNITSTENAFERTKEIDNPVNQSKLDLRVYERAILTKTAAKIVK